MNSVEKLAADGVKKLKDSDGALYLGIDGSPSYIIETEDEMSVELVDGTKILVIVLDPGDPSNNLGLIIDSETKEKRHVDPDNVEAMAEYMLSFVVEL